MAFSSEAASCGSRYRLFSACRCTPVVIWIPAKLAFPRIQRQAQEGWWVHSTNRQDTRQSLEGQHRLWRPSRLVVHFGRRSRQVSLSRTEVCSRQWCVHALDSQSRPAAVREAVHTKAVIQSHPRSRSRSGDPSTRECNRILCDRKYGGGQVGCSPRSRLVLVSQPAFASDSTASRDRPYTRCLRACSQLKAYARTDLLRGRVRVTPVCRTKVPSASRHPTTARIDGKQKRPRSRDRGRLFYRVSPWIRCRCRPGPSPQPRGCSAGCSR